MEHHFNVAVAKEYGIEEAVILHNLHYWIYKNRANGVHFHEGLYWTYNSRKAFAELFPYINETKVFRVMKKLQDSGIVKVGNFSTDKMNRTNWYAITEKGDGYMVSVGYETLLGNAIVQNDSSHCVKMNNGLSQSEQCYITNSKHIQIENNNKEDNKLSEKVSASEESIRYADIQQCWNETNGDRLGRVNAMTGKRKSWIKHILSEHNIDCKTLMLYIRTLPYADHWLYNPNADHKNWKPDFDWWMKNTSGWFTKLTEGKVHKENPESFNAIINGTEMPFTDGGLFSQPTAESSSDAESSVVINGQTYR